jgi:hypothetical protein
MRCRDLPRVVAFSPSQTDIYIRTANIWVGPRFSLREGSGAFRQTSVKRPFEALTAGWFDRQIRQTSDFTTTARNGIQDQAGNKAESRQEN